MKPINTTVVIKELKNTYELESGIELYAKDNNVRYNYGEVVASSESNTVKAGDKVYYDSVSGSQLRHDGEKLIVLRERDIAIIDD